MDINTLLQQNSGDVNRLLRRYRVFGPTTIDTINTAHRQHGAPFMAQLMAILTPTSSFGHYGNAAGSVGVIDTATTSQQAATPQKGKFWSFWDKLLSRVDATGKTIGQFKYDSAGNAILTGDENYRQQQNQNRVLIIAGLIVLALVAVLIFKKS